MEPKAYNYASYKLSRISDLVEVADILGTDWIFRGQVDVTDDITSSQEREALRLGKKDITAYESEILKKIKLATSFPECQASDPKDDFSWLALLQHHGCKTRLVDFTESFYVALYFAVRDLPAENNNRPDNNPSRASAIWATRKSKLDGKIASLGEKNRWEGSPEDLSRRLINNSIELPLRYENSTDGRLAIAYGKPGKINQRMIAQQGLFLCPLQISESFMGNLTKGLGLTGQKEPIKPLNSTEDLEKEAKNGKVIRIKIPKDMHRNLLFHLRKMNITEATLFPGLDGYARSLNYFAIGME